MVATPTYTGEMHHTYVSSLMAALVYCLYHKVELELRTVPGASLIQYARNQLVREFLEDETYTHLMWIDADVGFDPRAIMQLLEHGKDVVGGVYPMKVIPLEWPYSPVPGEQSTELHRAEIMPGGFLLCSRHAIETVAKQSGEYWHHMGGMRYRTPHVFDVVLENESLLGEDVIFCRRLHEAGFDIWCDPNLPFQHSGRFQWRGTLAKAIEGDKVRQPIPARALAAMRTETDEHELGHAAQELFQAWGNPWAMPTSALVCLALLARKATVVLETGSGISTLVMAAANPDAQIHVLEDDWGWAKRLEDECVTHGLKNVTIHKVPLESDGFYAVPDDLPTAFDLVVHDGPVDPLRRHVFFDRFADRIKDAVLVVDDSAHFKEQLKRFRHRVVGDRYAICLPERRMVTSTAA
jgi:predicted O-methyltransferase YrrM